MSFFLLAPYVAFESLRALLVEHHPETSWVGIGLTAGTLAICPGLGIAKLRLGEKLGSPATKGEGTQNLLCAYLAAAVLIGLVANTAFGLWWLDPVAGLVIAGACVRAGRQTWRGETCECVSCPMPAAAASAQARTPANRVPAERYGTRSGRGNGHPQSR